MMIARWMPREAGAGLLDSRYEPARWVDRFFEDFSRPLARRLGFGEGEGVYPTVDLRERDSEYVLRADVPGLRREDLEIDVAAEYVTLRGHYEEDREEDQSGFVCRERSAERFERIVRVPGEIQVDGATASLKDGVLTLHLPKTAVTATRRIEVTEH
ncbi:MAG: Hsp20/alpha crystallin family protein [Deltaproteobacteria bacterium]|nr:Hsp20/alpha crystallin family protein [Deltaproteobacteria bacterium]